MLVSVGNATGVFKAVIKYVAGVPQMLLDFVKTINDEHGCGAARRGRANARARAHMLTRIGWRRGRPLEEVRATYGPVNYALTEYINRIHVLLALTAASTGDDAKYGDKHAWMGNWGH